MLAVAPEPLPSQPDLNATAARAAEARYWAALAAGMPERGAWDEAVELFRMHHPAWPLPLAESEAARTVGGLIGARRSAIGPEAHRVRTPPGALLRRLAQPASPRDFSAASATPARPSPSGLAQVPIAARPLPTFASPG